MLGKIALGYIILFCIFSVSAQEKTDREKSDLAGYVKSVREETAKIIIKNGEPFEKNREISSIEVFDVSGKRLSYSFGKNEDSEEKIIYDEKGRISEIIRKKQPYSNLIPKKTRKYDENDRLTEENGFDEAGNLLGKRTYRYNRQGKLIAETSEGTKGFYNNYIRKYSYDQNDRKIEEAAYKKVGEEWQPEDFRIGYYKQIYLYDSGGKIIAETRIGADEKVYQTYVYSFDEKGRAAETNIFNADGTVKERTKYTYDEFDKQGNCLKATEYEWITEDGKSFFQPSEVNYYKIEYFAEKEIKEFEARKLPEKPQNNQALQNTDKEEYAVYHALFEQWLVNPEIKSIVVKKFTDAHSFGDEKPLTIDSVLRPRTDKSLLESVAVDDYNEKNYRRSAELREDFFVEKSRIILVGDAQIKEVFSEGCSAGWKNFREKYPNSQGLTTVSRVGFNKEKTQAIVYLGHSFDCLGGAGHLVFLTKQSGVWKISSSNMLWIS